MSPLDKIAATAPDHIWLDLGEEAHLIEEGATFKDLGGVTWSEDNATGQGIKYVRALASTTGEAGPVAGGELGLIESHPNYVAGFKAGHAAGKQRATPPAATPAAPMEGVTEFNVGRWCLSEDDCIAGGIDFSAYERGVSDAAAAFSRNTSKAATAHPLCPRCGETTEPTNNAFDVAARLVRELQDETAARDKEAWMREASATLQRLARPATVAAPVPASALLTDTDLARIHRRVTGANRFDETAIMLMREVEHAVNEKRAEPAPASEAVAKWIDDPHDIEQGLMLNPAWLKLHGLTAKEAIATPTPGDSTDAPVQQAGELTDEQIRSLWQTTDTGDIEDDIVLFARSLLSPSSRQRGALAFYANPANWTSCSSLERGPLVDEDGGDIARAALKGEQPVEPSGSERGEV